MESRECLKQAIEELDEMNCSVIDILDVYANCKTTNFVVQEYGNVVNETIFAGNKSSKILRLFKMYEGINLNTIYPIDNKIVTMHEFTIREESTYLFVLDIPLHDGRFLFTVSKDDLGSVVQWLSKTKLVIESHKERCGDTNIRDCYVIAMQYLYDHDEILPVFINEWDFLESKVQA